MYDSPDLRELRLPNPGALAGPEHPEASFGAWIASHLPAMTATARRVVRRSDLADDVVQDVIARVWRRDETQRPTRAALCHLVRLAALQQLRSDRRRCHHEACADPHHCDLELHDPPALLTRREQLGRVRSALSGLDPSQRDALELHVMQGLPYEQVALACGVAVGTVRSRLHRARRELSRRLGDTFVEELAA